ncbi:MULTISPECIES: hypothetical protein [unclassified Nocardioides]|uniref:hypothetical protein n=1 Tax=unclassified Nocardioides TaxID=2615069 RepID=UPI0026663D9F|nr:hypothetical protein [Nocardioides sp. Arc9.136]WKN47106.1 hypothetical protein OSR43_13770 [Nocardioides sp. Arc9.136]
MSKLVRTGVLAVAGGVSAGLITWGAPVAFADDERDDRGTAFQRKDDNPDVVMTVDDDDDDDTNDDTRTNTGTGVSKSTRDGTNSRFTNVSRDRDKSRSDLTRDWTRDGGDRTRDWSKNKTNDASRNDTRGR